MSRMKAYAGGIREHVKSVELGLGKVPDIGLESLVLFPEFLPLGLNLFGIVNSFSVFHDYSFSLF